jgi:sugar lactone lactonase YvrE
VGPDDPRVGLARRLNPVRDAFTEVEILADDIDHPEGVAWFDGSVWCGTEAGALLRIDPATGAARVVAETGGFLLGIAFDGRGRCYVCDSGQGRVLRIDPTGSWDVLADRVAGRRLVSPNFPAFTSDGTLWVTESGNPGANDGYLFRIPPGASDPEIVSEEVPRFPNGMAVDAGESKLYVVESRLPGVVTFDLRGGDIGPRDEFVVIPEANPDGLAFDVEGNLYVSCWRPDRVYRIRPGAAPEIYLDDPTGDYLETVTNVCFGGDRLHVMYLAGLAGRAIRRIPADVPGLPLAMPNVD